MHCYNCSMGRKTIDYYVNGDDHLSMGAQIEGDYSNKLWINLDLYVSLYELHKKFAKKIFHFLEL